MRLFNFLMFCLILAGCNMLITALSIIFSHGPDRLNSFIMADWMKEDHPLLWLFILGLDVVSFAIFLINTVPTDKTAEKKR